MKTSNQLIAEVESELNAVRAADMGLEAVEAFALDAQAKLAGADIVASKNSIDNLVTLVRALRTAVPANVTPASAGPVGKSPHEQYLEEASAAVKESLDKINEVTVHLRDSLKAAGEAVQASILVTGAVKQKDRAA